MPVWATAYPLRAVVSRETLGAEGLDTLECGHTKKFIIEPDGFALVGVRRRCRDCFEQLPEEEKRAKLDRLKKKK